MISRRHIRVKSMQALYASYSKSATLNVDEALKDYYNNILQSKILLVNIISLAKEICEYAIIDKTAKGSKMLPTTEDLNLSIKASTNGVVTNLNKNESFNNFIKSNKINTLQHADYVRSQYKILVKDPFYKQYIKAKEHSLEEDQALFAFVIGIITKQEEPIANEPDQEPIFPEHFLEDISANFLADAELIAAWVEKNKHRIGTFNYNELLGNEKRDFGEELINTYIEKEAISAEIIKPKLINWDSERIATMDRLILQMGITELLYFTQIPTKVTINEYIDIAKMFSTLQSGMFVNGVLDKIYKDLVSENKIHKTDYKPKKKTDA